MKCVTLEWVYDSISKGYALPFNSYTVMKSTSTPTKENEIMNPDFSVMSAIAPIGGGNEKSVLQETMFTNSISKIGFDTPTLKRKSIIF